MLPQLTAALDELRSARARLTDSETHELLSEAAPANGGGDPGRRVGEAFLTVRGLLAGLQALGLVVREIEGGLVDFPAIREGREVYLCWRAGEESVCHWHELDTGFGGRRPLE